VSALWYRSFIYVVYADNLLCTWLTDHIYVALNGFTYVTTSVKVENSLTTNVCCPSASVIMMQAQTMFLSTSNPQQMGCTTEIIL